MDLNRNQLELYAINKNSDIGLCRRKAVSLAKQIGFNDVNSGEVAIIITELATNVLKHGGGIGKFLINRIENNENNEGIEIWCCDSGNGFKDIQKASEDGYSDKSSLGLGIGAIRRLSDEFDFNPNVPENLKSIIENGSYNYKNCIRTTKWLTKTNWIIKNNNISIGAASRAKPGETLNGDDYVIVNLSSTLVLVALIDGLGHGKHAHFASNLAKEQLLLKKDQPIELIMQYVHNALKGSRGAVLGLCKIDTEKEKLIFTGIGNIEGQVFNKSDSKSLISFGGIVGHNMRTPRVFEFDFKKGYTLCIYSDGITSNWKNQEIDWNENPQSNAEKLLNNNSRISDDATVIIIRHTA
ncbi:MAG: SpoIIE family protein phosphatase [Saprospiraceae bacterium]|nr:SpoIIE family protein phosphatase [Saprospiraceae bacterium]